MIKLNVLLIHCSFSLSLPILDCLDGKVVVVGAKKRDKKEEQKLPGVPLGVEHCEINSFDTADEEDQNHKGIPLVSLSSLELSSFSFLSRGSSLRLKFSFLSFSLLSFSLSLLSSLRLPLSLLSFSLSLSSLATLREMNKAKTNRKPEKNSIICLSNDGK